MANNSVKQSTGPKSAHRLSDTPQMNTDEKAALSALLAGIEGDRDPKQFLDPVNQKSEVPNSNERLEVPTPQMRSKAYDIPEGAEAVINRDSKTLGTRTMLRTLGPKEGPLTPEEEVALMKLLQRTAKPL